MSQYITLEMGGRYPCYWNRGSNTTLVSEYGTSITAIVDVNIHRFIYLTAECKNTLYNLSETLYLKIHNLRLKYDVK